MIIEHRASFLTTCAALGLTSGVVVAMMTAVMPAPVRPWTASTVHPSATLTPPTQTSASISTAPATVLTQTASSTRAPAQRVLGIQAYRNCGEAHSAGAAPVHRGEPGWGSHLDGDANGVGCDAMTEIDWPTSVPPSPTGVPSVRPRPRPAQTPEPNEEIPTTAPERVSPTTPTSPDVTMPP